MSQREKSGFSRYPAVLSVKAEEPSAVRPASIVACSFNGLALRSIAACDARPSRQSLVVGVAQPANFTACSKLAVCFLPSTVRPVASIFSMLTERPPLGVFGVGHPEQSLTDVRRADARSAQIGGPDGISQRLQVSAYSGEPFAPIAACNLLSKDCWRTALSDKPEHFGPQVPLVRCSLPLADRKSVV